MKKTLLLLVIVFSFCLLSDCGGGGSAGSAVASHFSVTAPAMAIAGTAFQVIVTALDASNDVAVSYSGTVHFSSSDGQAMLPANSTLTNGTRTFSVTLKSGGNQTIAATDMVTASITGISNSISITDPATHLSVTTPAAATAGVAFNFTVTALDALNNTAIGYSGTVHFTSTDSQAVLPANSTLTNGMGTFSVTLKSGGSQTIAAADMVTASIKGTSNSIDVSPASAANPVPLINQPLIPTAVAPRSAALTLAVNGTGFVSGSVVRWNGSPRTTTFLSKSKLTAAILASDLSTPNTASVTVVNPAPGGGTSNVSFFEITQSTSWVALSNPTQFSVGSSPFSIATGEFNGDGKLDLAVANDFSNSVSILLGNGDGTFRPAAAYSAGSGPIAIAVGDFNADGKLDLAIANNGSGDVTVFLGNGDGTFQPGVAYSAGSGPIAVAAGDFNADGKLDLAVANNGSGDVTVLLGRGNGTFEPGAIYTTGQGASSVAVGDFNEDGKLDLAVTNNISNNVSILLGKGDGTFQPHADYSAGNSPGSAVVADFNGDGNLDLALADTLGNQVSVLLGNGDGTFQSAAAIYNAGFEPSLAVGDLNGDGKLDLAVANIGSGDVTVLLGNGDGTFQPTVTYTTGQGAISIAVGDFNGDGKLDLAVPGTSSTVSILLQTEPVSGPNATVSATTLRFECRNEINSGCQCITSRVATLSNFGSETLNINAITISGPFSQGNNCGSSLEPGRACTIAVKWSETNGGGVLSLFDNADGSPQNVSLSGVKLCPQATGRNVDIGAKPVACVRK